MSAMNTPARASDPDGDFIRHGTPAFRRANLALFALGLLVAWRLYYLAPLAVAPAAGAAEPPLP